jgi:serine/threonine protein kinase
VMEEAKKPAGHWKDYWWLVLLGVVFFAFLGNAGVDVAVPIAGMLFVTLWIVIPFWFAHKRKIAKEQTQADPVKEAEQQAEMKRMKERMENLEAIICNLDREMNVQLERTMDKLRLSSLDRPEVSQMPTTFMNIASALEGRYQVMKELGRGGMGIVFQAHDKQLNESVAIKILSPLLSNDTDALERLRREVSAARRITHPNVIRIHDISEAKGLQYVSMEYFNGRSLKDYIRSRNSLSQKEALNIAVQIADALEAAHRQGVVHRDLKSQNVLVDSANQVKVIDFGLAHSAHLQGMTATGLIMGTPEYMAPEQVAGRKVDERADIYALGIILYELFTGRVPFTGDSAIAVGFRQMKEPPAPPRNWNPELPEAIERVVLKALEKEPLRRYSTVTELKTDLERAVLEPIPTAKTAGSREMKLERER